ncbi:MAG TPA: ribonuclease P protein component [Anaerolineaceae bacterium]|nr:ribonuclease P protein component [Anaerolineaceae bacterium]
MNRKFRLTRSADFKKIKDSGNVYFHPIVKMAVRRNELPHSRFAVITSKIIGSAVERNRCKRRVRAVLNLLRNNCEAGWDIVFIIRKDFNHSSASEVQTAVENLFSQAGLLTTKEKIYDR